MIDAAAAWRTITVRTKTREAIRAVVMDTTQSDVGAIMPPIAEAGYAIYRAVEALSLDDEP